MEVVRRQCGFAFYIYLYFIYIYYKRVALTEEQVPSRMYMYIGYIFGLKYYAANRTLLL